MSGYVFQAQPPRVRPNIVAAVACLLAALTATVLAALGADLTRAGGPPAVQHDWTAEENTAVITHFYAEVWNEGNLVALPNFLAVDHRYHDADLAGVPIGPEGMAQVVSDLRRAFPDLQIVLDDILASGDQVAVRFTARGTHLGRILGAEGSGEPISVTGTALYRLADRQIVESWVTWDTYSLAEQLGLFLLRAPTDGSWEGAPGRSRPEGAH